MATRTPRKNEPGLPRLDSILDAALDLIGEGGFAAFTLQAVADRLKVPVAQVVTIVADRGAVLDAAARRLDHQMLDGITLDDEAESTRDRLFDILMRRIDAATPHKAAVARALQDGWKDPALTLRLMVLVRRSLRVMLEAAGVSVRGLHGQLRIKGMGAVAGYTVRAWLDDDSADLAKTMKALDKALDRACEAEDLIGRCAMRKRAEPHPSDAAAL